TSTAANTTHHSSPTTKRSKTVNAPRLKPGAKRSNKKSSDKT
ncbi:uncharacterized protein METZ01_LOCUS128515, partial [marine metagenome]